MTADENQNPVRPTGDGNLDVSTLVELLAREVEVNGNPTALAPSEGRVAKDSTDGTVWLGTGDTWLNVEESVGLDAPSANIDKEVNKSDVRRIGANGLFRYDVSENTDIGPTVVSAISDIDASMGGKVKLPWGEYDLGETLQIPPTTGSNEGYKVWKLKGSAGGAERFPPMGTQLYSTVTDGSALIKTPDFRMKSTVIGDFSIEGSGAEGAAVDANIDDRSEIKNILINNTGDGFRIDGGGGGWITNLTCRGIESKQKPGFVLTGVLKIGQLEAERGSWGVFFKDSNALITGDVEGRNCVENGVYINPRCAGMRCRGEINVDNNDKTGFVIAQGGSNIAEDIKIELVTTTDNSGGGVKVNGRDVTIDRIAGNENTGSAGHLIIGSSAERVDIKQLQPRGSDSAYDVSSDAIDVNIRSHPSFNGEVRASPGSATYTLSFDVPFSSLDVLDLSVYPTDGTTATSSSGTAYQWEVTGYTTNSNGEIASVDVDFYDSSGSSVTPTDVTWQATATNAGVY